MSSDALGAVEGGSEAARPRPTPRGHGTEDLRRSVRRPCGGHPVIPRRAPASTLPARTHSMIALFCWIVAPPRFFCFFRCWVDCDQFWWGGGRGSRQKRRSIARVEATREREREREGAMEASLFNCCGSSKWSKVVAALGPFDDRAKLLEAARKVWWNDCNVTDWLEAFTAHPRIGVSVEIEARVVGDERGRVEVEGSIHVSCVFFRREREEGSPQSAPGPVRRPAGGIPTSAPVFAVAALPGASYPRLGRHGGD